MRFGKHARRQRFPRGKLLAGAPCQPCSINSWEKARAGSGGFQEGRGEGLGFSLAKSRSRGRVTPAPRRTLKAALRVFRPARQGCAPRCGSSGLPLNSSCCFPCRTWQDSAGSSILQVLGTSLIFLWESLTAHASSGYGSCLADVRRDKSVEVCPFSGRLGPSRCRVWGY